MVIALTTTFVVTVVSIVRAARAPEPTLSDAGMMPLALLTVLIAFAGTGVLLLIALAT